MFGGLVHFLFFNILGISSSQLTNSLHHFQRGRAQLPTRSIFTEESGTELAPCRFVDGMDDRAAAAPWRG